MTGSGTGTLTINANNTLDVENGPNGGGATLDGVKVTDNGALDIGDVGAARSSRSRTTRDHRQWHRHADHQRQQHARRRERQSAAAPRWTAST